MHPVKLLRQLISSRNVKPNAHLHGITREHVLWAYRILLDRDPESEDVVFEKMNAWRGTAGLRADIMSSAEFREKNPDVAYTVEPNIVIKELDDGLRLFVDLSDYAIGLLRKTNNLRIMKNIHQFKYF